MRTKILAVLSAFLSLVGIMEAIAPNLARMIPTLAPLQWAKSLFFLATTSELPLPAPTSFTGIALALLAGPAAVLSLIGLFKVVDAVTQRSPMARVALRVSAGISIALLANYALFMQLRYPDLFSISPDVMAGTGYAALLLGIVVPTRSALGAQVVESITNPERGLR